MDDGEHRRDSGDIPEQWIELNTLIPSGSPTKQQQERAIPQLRLDTSNLNPPDNRNSSGLSPVNNEDGEAGPKSAILGLASNLAGSNWLPHDYQSHSRHSSNHLPSPDGDGALSATSSKVRLGSPAKSRTSSRTTSRAGSRTGSRNDHSPSRASGRVELDEDPFIDESQPHAPIPKFVLNVQRSFHSTKDEDYDDISSENYRVLTHNSSAVDDSASERPLNESLKVDRQRPRSRSHSPSPRRSGRTRGSSTSPRRPSPYRGNSTYTNGLSPGHIRVNSSHSSPDKRMSGHLTLSGAAFAAQQDFLDAEEGAENIESRISENMADSYDMSRELDGDDDSLVAQRQTDQYNVPMGRTLFYFESQNRLRRVLFYCMRSRWCSYLMVLLTVVQIIVLCVELRNPFAVENNAAVISYPTYMIIYICLYSVYTLLFLMGCVAFGVFTNDHLSKQDVKQRLLWAGQFCLSTASLGAIKGPRRKQTPEDPLSLHKCVLRSSWGRVEAISIIFFWLFLGMSETGYIESVELFIAGISHLRVLHILDHISHTRTVLHVIKTAIPFLQNVFVFIAFFVCIWTIIGVQSFNGSLRRVCVYGDIITSQHCGSWLDPDTLKKLPYVLLDERNGSYRNQSTIKGYTCPVNSICVELRAFPSTGSFTEMANKSFDNIFKALEIVLIMMSNNGFTDILYEVVDSEYLVSSLFFISGVLVLGIWLINLMVAVMVSSYAAVRRRLEQDDSTSSYSNLRGWIKHKLAVPSDRDPEYADSLSQYSEERSESETDSEIEQDFHRKTLQLSNWYGIIHLCFTLLAFTDLIVQACLTAPENNLFPWELFLALSFGVEIILRFFLYLPNWRLFLSSLTNLIDLALAIANAVAIVFYGKDEAYAWLTSFQLLRIYRLVGAIKYSRVFWIQIFGNFEIFASLTVFYFLTTLLCTLIATKMLRGQFPLLDDSGNYNKFSFYDLAASYFSMYQVSSTENWTDVLFWTTDNVSREGGNVVGLACMGILFFGWLFFANFLVLNLFIGVMSENLHGSISNKREEQVRRFAEEISGTSMNKSGALFGNVLSGFDALHNDSDDGELSENNRHVTMSDKIWAFFTKLSTRNSTKNPVLNPIRAAVEQKFVIEFLEANGGLGAILTSSYGKGITFLSLTDKEHQYPGFNNYSKYPLFQTIKRKLFAALGFFHHYPADYRLMLRQSFEARHQQAIANSSEAFVEAMFDSNEYGLTLLNEYCLLHPNFDKTLFLFGKDNRIRLFFQRIFTSSNGSRRSKVYPKRWVQLTVRLFFMAATVVIVILTCVNTPLEALKEKRVAKTWTLSSKYDVAFGALFTIEFLGKVIADGFHFTPNAYTSSLWNDIDLIVLISIWMTFVNDILHGPLSRYVRALMALRALRLLGFYSDSFHVQNSGFKHGLRNILGAVIIMMSIVIPYSVWGKNIFHNRLSACNDGNIEYFTECSGEYTNTVFDNFNILSPRAIQGQYFDYDNFWDALLIQFGVLSLEGWVDVLQAISSISSSGEQSITYASKGNGAYAILYNYIGTVLIITMLIAVIIRNYAIITGTAFLTEQQLSWLDVKRTLHLIRPTPKLPAYKHGSLRAQLLEIMPTWIQSIEIWTLFVVTVNLAAYFYPTSEYAEKVYLLIQVACSVVLTSLGVIRLVVLKPTLFLHNWWNPFGLVVCILVETLTIVMLVEPAWKISGVDGVSRAAVIAMLMLWIPRTKRLYQFYSIGTAALTEISLLLRAWFTLYIAYAIALNQSFGLTKLGSQSTWTKNFRTIPKALIALFFMSCGEGWNEYLLDFTIAKPYCLENSRVSECGIPGFAYFLFISWNIVSMYVFANLFISLICEGCWYVYRSGPVNINELDIVYLLESWQQFDPRGTGFIRTRDLYRFLGRSQGYFSMSIFRQDPKYNVHRILAETNANIRTIVDPYGVDYEAINQYLADMPVKKFRDQRTIFELFTTQARLMAEPIPGGSGVRFSKLVLMFPLYLDMDPAESLNLKEFIELKAKLYEASMIMAAEFIASTWRAKKYHQQRGFEGPSSLGVHEESSQSIYHQV